MIRIRAPKYTEKSFLSSHVKCCFPKSLTYYLYVCANGKKQHESLKGRYWKEENIQKEFEDVLDSFTLTEHLASLISERLNVRDKELKAQLEKKEKDFHRNIKSLEDEESRLCDLLLSGTIDELTYKKKLSDIRDNRSGFN